MSRAAKPPRKRCQVAAAILSIEECRDIHQEWIDYFNGSPREESKRETRKRGEAVGDRKWHRRWVRKYNQVLRVLKELQ